MTMKIDRSISGALKSPDDYVLRIESQKDGRSLFKAEKKGVWTWIKANLLDRDSYNLRNINNKLSNADCILTKNVVNLFGYKIGKYNSKYENAQIHNDVLKKFVKIRVDNSILGFVTTHLQGLTPKTMNNSRELLVDRLLVLLKRDYPDVTFDKAEVEEIALKKYTYAVASNFNVGRKQLLNPEKDDLSDCLGLLRQVMKVDFKDLHLSDEQIDKYGKQAFREIFQEHQKNLPRLKLKF